MPPVLGGKWFAIDLDGVKVWPAALATSIVAFSSRGEPDLDPLVLVKALAGKAVPVVNRI
jgi:hypothetical protein